jgi:hypothetical protein
VLAAVAGAGVDVAQSERSRASGGEGRVAANALESVQEDEHG